MEEKNIYSGDSINVRVRDYVPSPHPVPSGRDVNGVYFDGYPQMVKEEGSKPVNEVKVEKDVRVAVRDGVRLALDVYRPDVEGERFPAILAWGF
jgi:predicted acyl esterase